MSHASQPNAAARAEMWKGHFEYWARRLERLEKREATLHAEYKSKLDAFRAASNGSLVLVFESVMQARDLWHAVTRDLAQARTETETYRGLVEGIGGTP